MKRFLLKIGLFFILMALIDIAGGWAFSFLRSKARNGQTRKNEYLSKEFNDEILILGSSRADHHYLPKVLEDSLHMTCYNAGEEGCGIITSYMRYKLARAVTKPKIIIYEVSPRFDFYEDGDFSSYLGPIRQYANREEIRDAYLDYSDKLEWLRMKSCLYRNNSKIIRNIKDALSPPDINKGYEPLYGVMQQANKRVQPLPSRKELKIDSLKYSLMEKFISEVKDEGIFLVLSISPLYNNGIDGLDYNLANELAELYDVPLLDNRECPDLQLGSDCWQDVTHLNIRGATVYSAYVARQLKPLFK